MSLSKGGIYTIKSIGDGYRVNVAGSSLKNGANVLSWDFNANFGGNETWVAIPTADGYKFRTQINGNKGQVLDEAVSSHTANLWEDHDGKNQQWKLEPIAYIIKNQANGKVIKTAAAGGQITTVPENDADESTWWGFIPQ